MNEIDVSGLTRAHLLQALYNASLCPGGMARLAYQPGDMHLNEAMRLVNEAEKHVQAGEDIYFDYVYGRILKVRLTGGDRLDPRLYDRDNGPGAAARVVARLREQMGLAQKDQSVDF